MPESVSRRSPVVAMDLIVRPRSSLTDVCRAWVLLGLLLLGSSAAPASPRCPAGASRSVAFAEAGAPSADALAVGTYPHRPAIWLVRLPAGRATRYARLRATDNPVIAAVGPHGDWILWWPWFDHAVSANLDGLPLSASRAGGTPVQV